MDKNGKNCVHSMSNQLKHERGKVPSVMDTEWDLNGNQLKLRITDAGALQAYLRRFTARKEPGGVAQRCMMPSLQLVSLL
jgi:hypothetical protein